MSGRCIKPICLRVISELREDGIELPIIATGGIRSFDDAREFFWAGAVAVSLGSEAFLASAGEYALSPLKARRILSLVRRVERWEREAVAAALPARLAAASRVPAAGAAAVGREAA
jgi:dihydroorotate dehydrogenase (NAD+) catalytic subunit